MTDLPIVDLDADLADADWPKKRWDLLDVTNADELRAYLAETGITVAQFKRLPVYTANVDRLPWLAEL